MQEKRISYPQYIFETEIIQCESQLQNSVVLAVAILNQLHCKTLFQGEFLIMTTCIYLLVKILSKICILLS